jgi:hypothetical protein
MQAQKRLDDQARQLERTASGLTFEAFIARERGASPALGGRSVFGWEKDVGEEREDGGELIGFVESSAHRATGLLS